MTDDIVTFVEASHPAIVAGLAVVGSLLLLTWLVSWIRGLFRAGEGR